MCIVENDGCLQGIASSGDNVILAQNYSTLVTYLENIVNITCFTENADPPRKQPFCRFILSHLSSSAVFRLFIRMNGFRFLAFMFYLFLTAFTRDSVYAIARICYRPSNKSGV